MLPSLATLAADTFLADFLKPHGSPDPFALFSFTWLIGPVIALVVMGVVFFTILLPLIKRGQERARLLATGERANAKILALQDTGMRINDSPQLQIMLEVYPTTGRPPFQASCISTISFLAIPRVQPGMMVPVRFDPQNPASVALEV